MRNLSLLGLILFFGLFQCTQKNDKTSTVEEGFSDVPSITELVDRGNYLVTTTGCNDCHTPKMMTQEGPVPDMTRRLMGYPAQDPLPAINKNEIGPGKWILFNNDLTAAVGPWGISYAANLTPHQTGLGNWTYEQFKTAMTRGKYKGVENARMLMPPMPWQSFTNMKEEDLKAIFEYLKSITPIENMVPNYVPPDEY